MFKKLPNTAIKNIDIKLIGKSDFLVSSSTKIGLTIVVAPNTNKRLHIQLPITFPIEISANPFVADCMLIISSGKLVPIETKVNPIIIFGIFNIVAGDVVSIRKAKKVTKIL